MTCCIDGGAVELQQLGEHETTKLKLSEEPVSGEIDDERRDRSRTFSAADSLSESAGNLCLGLSRYVSALL